MAVTKLGLGGPVASFASGGGESPPPAPTAAARLLLLGLIR
jgi:hypothetical protein